MSVLGKVIRQIDMVSLCCGLVEMSENPVTTFPNRKRSNSELFILVELATAKILSLVLGLYPFYWFWEVQNVRGLCGTLPLGIRGSWVWTTAPPGNLWSRVFTKLHNKNMKRSPARKKVPSWLSIVRRFIKKAGGIGQLGYPVWCHDHKAFLQI